MPALERLHGLRVVADPASLDATSWPADVLVLRTAPDEVFAIGATAADVADPDAIVESESGFAGARISDDDWHGLLHHIEWRLPDSRPTVAQGSVAGVPARLWLADGDGSMLVVAAVHADVLAERLGWSR